MTALPPQVQVVIEAARAVVAAQDKCEHWREDVVYVPEEEWAAFCNALRALDATPPEPLPMAVLCIEGIALHHEADADHWDRLVREANGPASAAYAAQQRDHYTETARQCREAVERLGGGG